MGESRCTAHKRFPKDDQARLLHDIGSIFIKATSNGETDWKADLMSLFRDSPFGSRRPPPNQGLE